MEVEALRCSSVSFIDMLIATLERQPYHDASMFLPSTRLDGKIALVTGTGSGLGRAIAIGLATAGADVGLTELPGKETAAEETAAEIRTAGRGAIVLPLDVRKLTMIGEAVERLLSAFGRIDILVNNAGVNVPKLAVDVTPEDWDVVLDTDLKGLFFTTQRVATRAMIPLRRSALTLICPSSPTATWRRPASDRAPASRRRWSGRRCTSCRRAGAARPPSA